LFRIVVRGRLANRSQIAKLEQGYPGGINAYVEKAKELLAASASGVNPFDGFKPEVSRTLRRRRLPGRVRADRLGCEFLAAFSAALTRCSVACVPAGPYRCPLRRG